MPSFDISFSNRDTHSSCEGITLGFQHPQSHAVTVNETISPSLGGMFFFARLGASCRMRSDIDVGEQLYVRSGWNQNIFLHADPIP